jgi:hypothetical protein
LPTDAQETELSETYGSVRALEGSDASTPWDQVPEDSPRRNPCPLLEDTVYRPTALQLPAEEHDTELSATAGSLPALEGSGASRWAHRLLPENAPRRRPCSLPEESE